MSSWVEESHKKSFCNLPQATCSGQEDTANKWRNVISFDETITKRICVMQNTV